MNKECRMSKESGLINFIILHSTFVIRYSKIFSWKITNMKSWGEYFGLKMLYIKLFRDFQKNILPESGKILELVKQPGQAGTKKEYRIMNKECRMSKESGLTNFIILHSLFLVRYSKNYFLPKNGKTLQQGNHTLIDYPIKR